MLMRYYWGLAVGHVYSHHDSDAACSSEEICDIIAEASSVNEARQEPQPQYQDEASDMEDPELGFDNREDDWIDGLGEDSAEELSEDEEDDEMISAMDDMYGFASNE
jgi:hypothetical protein